MIFFNRYIYFLFVFSTLFFSCEDKNSAKKQVPASIVITPVNSILKPNQTVQLYSLVIDKNNSEIDDPEVVWSSTNEFVAIVDQNGRVTTKSKGSTSIIATVENIQGMAEIYVSNIRRKILSEMFTSST